MMIKFINDIVVPIWGLVGIGKTKIAYIAIQKDWYNNKLYTVEGGSSPERISCIQAGLKVCRRKRL